MEDNEFEEVTIISHTDHGTSVLPQSTAERLMKEIKLEVTQKISQNENVKLGSLQHSTTPTLLDRLYTQMVPAIWAGDPPRKEPIISVWTNPRCRDQVLISTFKNLHTSGQTGFASLSGDAFPQLVSFVVEWNEHL